MQLGEKKLCESWAHPSQKAFTRWYQVSGRVKSLKEKKEKKFSFFLFFGGEALSFFTEYLDKNEGGLETDHELI